jgi:hypothetical protein
MFKVEAADVNFFAILSQVASQNDFKMDADSSFQNFFRNLVFKTIFLRLEKNSEMFASNQIF